ncbi:MAG: glycosyltransferase family 4 protein [Thermodesulfobacteriota bacterium]
MRYKKKITVISGIFYPDIGGPSTYLMKLLSDFTNYDLAEITVITYGEDNATYPFKVVKTSRSWPIIIRLFLFTIRCFIHGRKADIWFVNDYGFPAVLANVFLRKKIILKVAGEFAWEFSQRHGYVKNMGINEFQSYRSSKVVNIVKFIQKFYASQANLIVTPSNCLKKIITGWGIDKDRVEVIHNAIDAEKYRSNLTKEEARALFGIPKDKTILLTIARLLALKRIDDILVRLQSLDDSYYYVIAGEGPEMANLKRITVQLGIQNRAIFLGKVEHEDIPTLFKASDVFILNSEHEGLPHVLLEAAAAGVPSLISDLEGSREVVDRSASGIVLGDNFREDIKRSLDFKEVKLAKEFEWSYLFSRMKQVFEI